PTQGEVAHGLEPGDVLGRVAAVAARLVTGGPQPVAAVPRPQRGGRDAEGTRNGCNGQGCGFHPRVPVARGGGCSSHQVLLVVGLDCAPGPSLGHADAVRGTRACGRAVSGAAPGAVHELLPQGAGTISASIARAGSFA